MQPHHYIALAFICALGWAFLVLVRRSPDDAASGTHIGQVSREEDAFHHAGPQAADLGPQTGGAPWPCSHFIVVCCKCHRVKSSDARRTVVVGDILRVSHGLCPRCAAEEHAKLEAIAPAHLSPATT